MLLDAWRHLNFIKWTRHTIHFILKFSTVPLGESMFKFVFSQFIELLISKLMVGVNIAKSKVAWIALGRQAEQLTLSVSEEGEWSSCSGAYRSTRSRYATRSSAASDALIWLLMGRESMSSLSETDYYILNKRHICKLRPAEAFSLSAVLPWDYVMLVLFGYDTRYLGQAWARAAPAASPAPRSTRSPPAEPPWARRRRPRASPATTARALATPARWLAPSKTIYISLCSLFRSIMYWTQVF